MRWAQNSALIHISYVFLLWGQCLLYTPRAAVLEDQGNAEPNQLFFQTLPILPTTAKVGEAEAAGSPGSTHQQITFKMAPTAHFWFF